jgi:hypothetical protein
VPETEGRVLFDADGDFQAFFPVTIDTAALAEGWHSLMVLSRGPGGATSACTYCSELNHNHGAAKIWFYVQH